MLRKSFKLFFMFFQFSLIFLLVAVGAFFWRLHKAPIEVNEAIPFIIHALSQSDTSKEISIQSAVLKWGTASSPIDLIAKDFKALNNDGVVIASVPEFSLSFSLIALLRGKIAPKTIAIYRPYLNVIITKEGKIKSSSDARTHLFNLTQQSNKKEALLPVQQIIDHIKQEPYIEEFSLINAHVMITDQFHNAVWDIPDFNLTYEHTKRKNTLEGNLTLKTKKQPLKININGFLGVNSNTALFSFGIQNVDLAQLSLAERYPFLKNFATSVNATFKTQINLAPLLEKDLTSLKRSALEKVDFEITGAKGTINLPSPIFATYDLQRFSAIGSWFDQGDKFNITHFNIDLNQGSGSGYVTVQGIAKALDTGTLESITATLDATTLDIPIDKLALYWPASITTDVHNWVKDNLKGGVATTGTFALHFIGLKNDIDADEVFGTVNVSNTSITYMQDMPAVENASGVVNLTRDTVSIDIDSGHTFGVNVKKGVIVFSDLTQEFSKGHLNLDLYGNLTDALIILDQKPLGFTKDMGIDPNLVQGVVFGNLQLDFPIGDAFKSPDQIKAFATAKLEDATLNNVVLNYDLTNVTMDLEVRGFEVNAKGTGNLYSSNAEFTLYQNFNPNQHLKTKINFSVALDDATRSHFDFNSDMLVPPTMSGILKTSLVLTEQRDKSAKVNIDFDLTDIDLYIRQIGWEKPKDLRSSGNIELILHDNVITSVPTLSFSDLNHTLIKGRMNFDENHKLHQIELNPIKTGRTNAKARISFLEKNGLKVDLTGQSLDLTGIMNTKSLEQATKENKPNNTKETDFSVLDINAVIDEIWLSKTGFSKNNALSALRDKDVWQKIEVVGHVGDKNIPLNFVFSPQDKAGKVYKFSLASADAGGVLKALDYISTIKGGKLNAVGLYTPSVGSKGVLQVSSFSMTEMPVFSKILMLSSFTGIIDLFKGEGLAFDEANVPFVVDNDTVTIKDALISGSSLGITLSGKLYRDTNFLNLRGSLVPFYSLNSFLGKIPLIGTIFAGEKGGGLIAPTYTVKGKLPSPDVSVNAFSVLALGGIRELFGSMTNEILDESKILPSYLEQRPVAPEPAKTPDKKVELPVTLEKIPVPKPTKIEKILTNSLEYIP